MKFGVIGAGRIGKIHGGNVAPRHRGGDPSNMLEGPLRPGLSRFGMRVCR